MPKLTSDQKVTLMVGCMAAGATIAQHGTNHRKLSGRANDALDHAHRFYEKLTGEKWPYAGPVTDADHEGRDHGLPAEAG